MLYLKKNFTDRNNLCYNNKPWVQVCDYVSNSCCYLIDLPLFPVEAGSSKTRICLKFKAQANWKNLDMRYREK